MLGEELYAERNRDRQVPDRLIYEPLPQIFKNQVEHFWCNTIGYPGRFDQGVYILDPDHKVHWWKRIHNQIVLPMGLPVHSIFNDPHDPAQSCVNLLFNCAQTDWVLTLVQVSFLLIDQEVRKAWEHSQFLSEQQNALPPDQAIAQLNRCFQSNSLGYRFEQGQIIKISSQFLHEEITKPALELINDPQFATASSEFTNAHTLHMSGQYKQAIVEATKALESALKTICHQQNWPYDPRDTLTKLIETVISQGLIDKSLTSNYTSLTNLLKQVTAIRNKAAHGQGSEPNAIPERTVNYVLHSVANEITFLVTSCQEFEQS